MALDDALHQQKIDVLYHDLSQPLLAIHDIAKSEGILL